MQRVAEGATDILVEDDISGEMVLACNTPDTPTYTALFIADENSFIAAWTTLDSMLQRDDREALTPPDTEM